MQQASLIGQLSSEDMLKLSAKMFNQADIDPIYLNKMASGMSSNMLDQGQLYNATVIQNAIKTNGSLITTGNANYMEAVANASGKIDPQLLENAFNLPQTDDQREDLVKETFLGSKKLAKVKLENDNKYSSRIQNNAILRAAQENPRSIAGRIKTIEDSGTKSALKKVIKANSKKTP